MTNLYSGNVWSHNDSFSILHHLFSLRPITQFRDSIGAALKLTKLLIISEAELSERLRDLYKKHIAPMYAELPKQHRGKKQALLGELQCVQALLGC